MKSLIKYVSLTSLVLAPFAAQAQQPAQVQETAAASNPLAMSNFKLGLLVQGRYSLTNTTVAHSMDMFSQKARFAIGYNYKNVFAEFEAEAGSPQTSQVASGSTFVIRKAVAGFNFVNTPQARVALVLGRDHLVGSSIYAPDALGSYMATNFANNSAKDGEDGLGIRYAGTINEMVDLNVGLGFYRDAGFTLQPFGPGKNPFATESVPTVSGSFAAGSATGFSATQSRAIVVNAQGAVAVGEGKVEAGFLYAHQDKVPTAFTPSSTAGQPGTFTASNLRNLEGSVGYNFRSDELKGGVWVQHVDIGETQTGSSATNSNDISYSNAGFQDGTTITTVGFGVTGNSKLFGLTNLISEGDALTYGAAYQHVSNEIRKKDTPELKVASSQFNIAAGYQQSVYSLELNFLSLHSDKDVYFNKNNEPKKTANILYLVGSVSL